MSVELELIKSALVDNDVLGLLADWYEDNGRSDRSEAIRKYLQPKATIDYQKVHVRWMIRRDMPDILTISSSLDVGWGEDEFLSCLRQKNCVGMVAETGERVVAYMVYELHKNKLDILNFAVHRRFRNKGIGRQMIGKLVSKLRPDRRTHLTTSVNLCDLDYLVFLKRYGFSGEVTPKGIEMTYHPAKYHKDY